MKTLLAAAMLVGGLAMPATAATIVNGSFEVTPQTVNNWKILRGGIEGWRTISGDGIEIQTDRTLGRIDAQEGGNYVELDTTTNTAIAQTVELEAGQYELSFYYSPRVGGKSDTNDITYAFGDFFSEIFSKGDLGSKVGEWTLVTQVFTVAEAGSYDLIFGGTGASDKRGGLIDNVSLAAVPLPAGLVLLLTGLGGLGLARRRAS